MNRLLFGLTVAALFHVSLSVDRAEADEVNSPPSFARDVQPLLTKLGCNQGACHGKLAGQNGFRLSLRGFAPDWDHFWITREFSGRRINQTNPLDSLLIQKPLGTKPHAGGRLMAANSREQQVLTDWLKAGAPGPVKEEPTVVKLTISPTEHLLSINQTQPLTVTAEYTDGKQRDVTWLTVFTSNDAAVAEIDRKGVITAHRSGETGRARLPPSRELRNRMVWREPRPPSSTRTSSRNSPRSALNRPLPQATKSSFAACSSTRSERCRPPMKCEPSWPTRQPTSERS